MATVWFVRHGERVDETDGYKAWARSTPTNLRFDPNLTEAGKAQARDAGRVLKASGVPFPVAYVSAQMRCLETAAQLGYPLHVMAGLAQCAAAVKRKGLKRITPLFPHNRRHASGTVSEAHHAVHPAEIADIDETDEKFAASVRRLVQRHPGEHVLVVTHREGIRDVLGLSPDYLPEWRSTPYACVSVMRLDVVDGVLAVQRVFYPPTAPADALIRFTLPHIDEEADAPAGGAGASARADKACCELS